MATIDNSKPVVIRAESQRPAAKRARPANFGGPRLKLNVIGAIPGYHLYWENDDGQGALETLLHEGFEFVEPSEVKMESHIVVDGDIANRLSRFVGTREDGSPMRAYLLKCTDEVWQEREDYRYAEADRRDQDIRSNRVDKGNGQYKPQGMESSLDTGFSKSY